MSQQQGAKLAAIRLGEVLKAARVDADMTQDTAAVYARRTRQLISQIELGEVAEPSAEVLARLAAAYRVELLPLLKLIGYHGLAKELSHRPQAAPKRPTGTGRAPSAPAVANVERQVQR